VNDVTATHTVELHRIAHARSGDKGNHSNIAVFAYAPTHFATLLAEVTEARVATLFAARRPTHVTRYVLPQLHGLNFVLENVLDGGVNDSLNLDMHGKALSFLLLSLAVEVPVDRLSSAPGVTASSR
jgi:hypothetical protein